MSWLSFVSNLLENIKAQDEGFLYLFSTVPPETRIGPNTQ